jgi:WD40 repeat protein
MGRGINLLINISVSPDGQKVAACNSSGKTVVWSTAGGEVLERLPGGKSRSADITFTDGNKVLVLSSDGKSLTLTDGAATLRSLELQTDPTEDEAPPPRVFTLAFTLSADGKVVAIRDSKDKLSFFDLPSLSPKRAAQAALPEHLSLATLSDDGKLLAAYKRDERSIVVLSTETGEQQNVLQLKDTEPYRLAFSHDAKRVAIGMKSDRLIVWHLSTSQQLDRAITGDPGTLVRSLAFSADTQTLAVGTMFGGIVLFDLASGRALVESLGGQRDVVQNLVFSPDGKQLVASYPDGGVVLWDINIDSWIGQARDIANRGLSDGEYQQYVSNP